jgi:hypothetical protein
MDASTTVRMLRETYELAANFVDLEHPSPERLVALLFKRGLDVVRDGGALDPIRGARRPPLLERLNEVRGTLLDTEVRYVVTKLRTYVLTRKHEELERSWEALADVHAMVRQAVVTARAEEDQLKRRRAGLTPVERPAIVDDTARLPAGNAPPEKKVGPYAHVFDGATMVEVTAPISRGERFASDGLAETQGWSDDWDDDADLVVVAYGLSAVLREREAAEIDPNDPASVDAAYHRARERMMGLDSQVSTLRFRLFELTKAVNILTWRVTAIRTEINGLRQRLEQFTADRARLEDELATLPPPTLAPAHHVEEAAPAPPTWRACLSRVLRPLRIGAD